MKRTLTLLLLFAFFAASAQPVDAGKDTLIYLSQSGPDTALLTGSASAPGASFRWVQAGGPLPLRIASPRSASTPVTGLKEGVYTFRLTVNDKASDEVVVTVRDWQKKNVSPCRPGRGKAFVVPPSSQGSDNGVVWRRWAAHSYINRDNVLGERVMGGDTLYFEGTDSCTAFEIGDFGGGPGCPVYLLPKDRPVVIRNAFFRIAVRDSNVVQHAVLDGTLLRGKGYPYGWMVDNSHLPLGANRYTNLVASWVAHFTVQGLYAYNTGMLQIKIDSKQQPYGRYDKFIQKKIRLRDLFLNQVSGEALYIGHTASNGGQRNNPYGPPPRMDSVEISECVIMNAGYDGIQLANARSGNVIRHNLVYNVGLVNRPSQQAGILLGGNSNGRIDSNVVIRTTGNGIETFGWGPTYVRGNIIDSCQNAKKLSSGIYQKSVATLPEDNPPQSPYNIGNVISRTNRWAIRSHNPGGHLALQPGVNEGNLMVQPAGGSLESLVEDAAKSRFAGNRALTSFPIQLGPVTLTRTGYRIQVVQGDASASFTSTRELASWLLQRAARAE